MSCKTAEASNPDRSIALELLWAIGCLIGSKTPFPDDECRAFFTDLLRYIDAESDKSIRHALVCCLGTTLAKLSAPPVADASASPAASAASNPAAASPQHDHKQETISALIKLLSQARPPPRPPPRPSHFPPRHPRVTSGAAAASSLLTALRKRKATATAAASSRGDFLRCKTTRCSILLCRTSAIASTAWGLPPIAFQSTAARCWSSYPRS